MYGYQEWVILAQWGKKETKRRERQERKEKRERQEVIRYSLMRKVKLG